MKFGHSISAIGLGAALLSAVGAAAADPAPAAGQKTVVYYLPEGTPLSSLPPAPAGTTVQVVFYKPNDAAPAAQAPAPAPAPAVAPAPAPAPAPAVAPAPAPAQAVAPAPAPAPVAATPTVGMQLLQNDHYYAYMFLDNDTHFEAAVPCGSDIDFKIGEDAGKQYWRLVSCDPAVCRVKLEHDSDGVFPFRIDKAEIELKAVMPGKTDVVFVCGPKRVTVHFTAM